MELIKYNYQDGLGCATCANKTETARCLDVGICSNGYKYANAEQLKGLIEEAEQGYEWSKANGLWACPSEKKCGYTCSHRGPHIFLPETEFRGCTTPRGQGGYTCPSCIPHRGEPNQEDTMEINGITHVYSEGSTGPDNGGDVIRPIGNGITDDTEAIQALLKEDDVKEEVPSNARELEYRVKKCFAAYTLSSTDINPEDFKLYYMLYRGSKFDEGDNFTIDPKTEGPTHDIMLELLRLGYIEEVVADPVVEVGDCFKFVSPEYGVSLYRVVLSPTPKYPYLICIEGDEMGNTYQGEKDVTSRSMVLSDFVGKSKINIFTPCKIDIREVEE